MFVFFIHSLHGYLSGFRILATINNAIMDIEVHISFVLVFSFSSDKHSEVELLDHTVVLLSVF